ncbi:MAG: EH signature domain-containing protein [Pseudomonadota bacterium]|nr:EH signature domain-containing protein [Pseudomonadota bacterium]
MPINQWLHTSHLFEFQGFPTTFEVQKALQKIRTRFGEGFTTQMPNKYDSEFIYKEVSNAWQKEKTLHNLNLRTLKRAPFILLREDIGPAPGALGDHQPLLSNYLEWLTQTSNYRSIKSLLSEFLYRYNPEASWFDSLNKSLTVLLQNATTHRLTKIKDLTFQSHFLDKDGPRKLTDRILKQHVNIESALGKAGLQGRLAVRGFVKHVFNTLSQDIRSKITDQNLRLAELKIFTDWVVTGKGCFRFPENRTQLINNLLEPFSQGDDPENAKQAIFTFLIKNAGDPRIDKRHWHDVSGVAQQVMKRWLVKSTLEDFFRLLKHVAGNDPDAERMWRDRQQFWTAYLRRNAIGDAWVVLGQKARQLAEYSFKEFKGSYGHLQGGNVNPLHSALLMRIDNLIIAEWSHNGKCHIWSENVPNKPLFYKKEYLRDELRNELSDSDINSPPFIHVKSNQLLWQGRVRNYIRKVTGIDVPLSELN